MQHTIVIGPLKENFRGVRFATKEEVEIFSHSFHWIRFVFTTLDFRSFGVGVLYCNRMA